MLIVMSLVTFLLFFAARSTRSATRAARTARRRSRSRPARRWATTSPLIVQWADFLKGIVKGRDVPRRRGAAKAAPEHVVDCPAPCLGYSVVNHGHGQLARSRTRFPVSLSLALAAFVMWMVGGVLFGVIAALEEGHASSTAGSSASR